MLRKSRWRLVLIISLFLFLGVQFYNYIGQDYIFAGRWYKKEINGKNYHVSNNLGNEIVFKVKGIKEFEIDWVKYGFKSNAYYSYVIDSGEVNRRKVEDNIIELPDDAPHIIHLIVDGFSEHIDRWEKGYGVAFGGVSCKAKAICIKKPVIAFLGDSITEGIRSLGIDDFDMGNTNSATNAYPWFCCKELNAIPYYMGYGGTGILNKGSFNTTLNTVKYLYKGVRETRGLPDLIVINVGTNDSEGAEFIKGYEQLLDYLNEMNPEIVIMCMVPFNQSHRYELKNILRGRENCYLIDTKNWIENMDFSDGTHPLYTGARVAGKKLAEKIDELNDDLHFY